MQSILLIFSLYRKAANNVIEEYKIEYYDWRPYDPSNNTEELNETVDELTAPFQERSSISRQNDSHHLGGTIDFEKGIQSAVPVPTPLPFLDDLLQDYYDHLEEDKGAPENLKKNANCRCVCDNDDDDNDDVDGL